MMGILPDNNVEGHMVVLVRILQNETWRDLWAGLELPVLTFDDLGLPRTASDALVWQVCQREEVLLLTANRNALGPDSLEATIRLENTPASLPVFTLADAQRLVRDAEYAKRVAERFLEYLLDIELYRGAGRLYLP